MSPPDVSTNNDGQAPKLYRFIGELFIWLTIWFIVWIFMGFMLAVPAVWLAEDILTNVLPEFVFEFNLNGSQALLVSNFGELDGEIVSARLAGDHLAFPINTQILTYSFPFYVALSFATNDGVNFAGLVRGLLVLYMLLIVGIISICLKSLMAGLGPVFIDGFSTSAAVIAIASQFSTLMIPTLAPLLVWAWQSRKSTYLRQLLVNK